MTELRELVEMIKTLSAEELTEVLLKAVRSGDETLVKFALTIGADANQKNPLALAAAKTDENIIKVLVEAGADVHQDNEQALAMAVLNGNIRTAKELLRLGAIPTPEVMRIAYFMAKNASLENLCRILMAAGGKLPDEEYAEDPHILS